MAYDYHFKYPRKKLHEIVGRYLSQMQMMRREPNCGVVFAADPGDKNGPDTTGWLLADRQDGDDEAYLLLANGDVWHQATSAWLDAPTDGLATLLARSLTSARTGGDAYQVSPEPGRRWYAVADRRSANEPHPGPERRRPGAQLHRL